MASATLRITLLLARPTAVFAGISVILATATSCGRKQVQPPESVVQFLHSQNSVAQAMEVVAGRDPSQLTPYSFDSVAARLRDALQYSASVDRAELNQVYLGWGDHYFDEWIPAVRAGLEAFGGRLSYRLRDSRTLMNRYDAWYAQNSSALFTTLEKRYGLQVR